MALRAYIQKIEFPTDSETHVVCVVTDDVRKVEVDWIGSSMDALKGRMRGVMGQVQSVDAELRALKVNDVLDLIEPGPAPFFDAWAQLQSELAKVDAGILATDDQRVTDARAAAKALDSTALRVGR